jgi:hypothetical protein
VPPTGTGQSSVNVRITVEGADGNHALELADVLREAVAAVGTGAPPGRGAAVS